MARLGGIYVDVRGKTDKYKRDLANAKTMTEKAAVMMKHSISKISFAAVAASAVAAGAAITKLGLDGFRAMEKMKVSVASMASTITSFAKGADTDLAGTYLQSLNYSEQLVLKMEELNAQTVATGENLTAMVETMAQHGVLLDINNQKQVKGFLAIANALALVTQGQNADIQFRQEIRGLMTGQAKATDSLARLLKQKVGGELKKHIELWREEGTLIENAGALLSGFSEGAKDLANTWLAVSTTIETMYNRTLRGMIEPVYKDIIELGKQITINALDQNSALNKNAVFLRTVVYKGWQDIKNITEVTVDIVATFEGPLMMIGKLLGMILDGWGQILAIIPAITGRIKLMADAMWETVKMIGNAAVAMSNTLAFQFDEAANAWSNAKENWKKSGELSAQSFSSGFMDELDNRINAYNKDLTIKPKKAALPPELKPIGTGDKDSGIDISGLFEPIGKDEFERDLELTELMEAEMEARLEVVKEFNEAYNELGKTKFDLEREQVERMTEIYREAGIEENKIAELTAEKNKQIAMEEQQAKLSIYQTMAGGIAETFQMIAEAGGEQSLAAFRAYQAFAAIEAGIAGEKAVSLALADTTIPSTLGRFAMAAVAGAKSALQVGLILSAQPPSYDVGGISNAKGVYQTGNIQEAHVPIPSGKIPVQITGNENQTAKSQEINIFNTVDPSVMAEYQASSRGQDAIFNAISRQPQRFKRLIR